MDSIESPILAVITSIRDFAWGAPLVALLVGTGNITGLANSDRCWRAGSPVLDVSY